jgi:leader peptidase (prepilin peptidase)/N-methyltransferase
MRDPAEIGRAATAPILLQHAVYILFLFAFGACVGSFLNVVVWRLPRGESLVTPPSHCPKCGNRLKWYDNLPVIGWIKLRGKCRFCALPISPRYPIVEALTGGIFVFYYAMFFLADTGPCAYPGATTDLGNPVRELALTWSRDWDIYALYILLLCVLLAGSLIDAEHFILPIEMFWYVVVPIALVWHAIIDAPGARGSLNAGPAPAAMAVGGAAGLLVSLFLWWRGWLPASFADGGPLMEVERAALEREKEKAKKEGREPVLEFEPPAEYTKARVRAEVRKEMLFLLPPLALAAIFGFLVLRVPAVGQWWGGLISASWVSGFLGSLLGMLVGGFIVWLTRIVGTYAFGREAMGMGDVHLMAAVGAVVGAGASVVAFFVAPFFGLALAVYLLFTGKRRELPYGPYLSMGTACVMLFYCPIATYLAPGMAGLRFVAGRLFGAGAGS